MRATGDCPKCGRDIEVEFYPEDIPTDYIGDTYYTCECGAKVQFKATLEIETRIYNSR